jgi:hypothetical protein
MAPNKGCEFPADCVKQTGILTDGSEKVEKRSEAQVCDANAAEQRFDVGIKKLIVTG